MFIYLSRNAREKYKKHQMKATEKPKEYISITVDKMDKKKSRFPKVKQGLSTKVHIFKWHIYTEKGLHAPTVIATTELQYFVENSRRS